ncbi:siphovirus ReqiPepy6 Gp37-like family protein [Streptomyces sp. NPDC047706]|uniref:siphovirus ReqiPepy6 Gp37-like family protein n=1 Tax=Streptomyces sp. NPDC047706 TaxID=3365486 RepID=UPI00371250E8
MTIQLLVTDNTLTVQGDPLTGWTSLDAAKKFNEPGAGSVTLPAYPEVMEQLQPGNRLVVIRDGGIWMGGPMEVPADFSWSIDGEQDPGQVTVSFSDDLALVAGYITWPEPANAWATQHGITYRQINATNAETIIRTLVNENCGPAAVTARRIPSFALDSVAGVGTATTMKTRFEPLLDAARRAAADGGGIGFRTRQVGTQILFGCYEPQDLTATARFSVGLGNLRGVTYKRGAPTVTHALVAGTETEGSTTRTFVEVADSAAATEWWRVERFIDGGADNNANLELTVAGRSDLADGSGPVELSTVTIDTPDLQAGRDFDLGDLVTVALPHGLEVTNIVRSIHLHAEPGTGESVTSVVGSLDATTDPQTVRLLGRVTRRLNRLEAR